MWNPRFSFFQLIIIGTVLCFAFSCSKGNIYENYKEVKYSVWKASDVKTFDVDIQDTNVLYNVYFQLRNNEDYEYSNLWIGMNIKEPNGEVKSKDFPVLVADENGVFLGSGIKGIYDNQFKIQEGVRFHQKGKYHIRIEQIMRDTSLMGIMDVGFKISQMKIDLQN